MIRGRHRLPIPSSISILVIIFCHGSYTAAQATDLSEPRMIQLTDSDDSYWPIWPPQWTSRGDLMAVEHSRTPTAAVILDSRTGGVIRDPLSTGICWVPRFSPIESVLVFSRLVPSRDHEEGIDERSIVLLDLESGGEQVIHKTRFRSETEWREWPSIWSENGRLIRISVHRSESFPFGQMAGYRSAHPGKSGTPRPRRESPTQEKPQDFSNRSRSIRNSMRSATSTS